MSELTRIQVSELEGVGPKILKSMDYLKLKTIDDLFHHFPYRYEEYCVIDIDTVQSDAKVTISGRIVGRVGKGRRGVIFFTMVTNNPTRSQIRVTLFNQGFRYQEISQATFLTVTGKYDTEKKQIIAERIVYRLMAIGSIEVIPVYTTKNIAAETFRKIVRNAFKNNYQYIPNDLINDDLLSAYQLINNKQLIQYAHLPRSMEEVNQTIRRRKYEELLRFQLKMQLIAKEKELNPSIFQKTFNARTVYEFISSLPFELTPDQSKGVDEIIKDLSSNKQMNRLVQGDVGAGKTIVAIIALYSNYLAGYQGALMSPTEILAEQLYKECLNLLSPLGIRVELLTSSVKAKDKKALLKRLINNEIDILVGTHSLISSDVEFYKLGLAAIDEQHRFGVGQRQKLLSKGEQVDGLFLTATPIPRTLAISIYGDMEITIIKSMPKGRKPIKTYYIKSELEGRYMKFVKERLDAGEQVYVISPLVEESEASELESATEVFEKYSRVFGDTYRVGLLHGKISNEEKDRVMNEFKENKIQILVATTVVEVGVNVPNATLIVIQDAHQFGVSQLHQLRGRVGRGDKQSYCLLVSNHENEKTIERLRIMEKTTDGFELSEYDLKLRGCGDFFGDKQSGIPDFKIADIIEDHKILECARLDAKRILDFPNERNPYRNLIEAVRSELEIDSNYLT